MEEVTLIDGNEAHSFSKKVDEIGAMVDIRKNLGKTVNRFHRTPATQYLNSIAREFQGNLVIMCRYKIAFL